MASFNYENGTTISSQNSSTVIQGPVTVRSSARVVELVFDLLKTSHAGRYICRASLDSPALDEALVKESVFQLNFECELQLLAPMLSSSKMKLIILYRIMVRMSVYTK